MRKYKFEIRGKYLFAEEMVIKLEIPRDDTLRDKVVAIIDKINEAEYESEALDAWTALDELLEQTMRNSKKGKVKMELKKVYFPTRFRPRRIRRNDGELHRDLSMEEVEKFMRIIDGADEE